MADTITVKIIDGYEFEQDKHGFILYEVKQTETGEYKDTLGYYSSVKTLLTACLQHATRKAADNAGVRELGDYVAIMQEIWNEIKAAVDLTAF